MPDKELLERVEDRLVTEEAAYLDVMEHGSSISTLHKTQRKLLQELQKNLKGAWANYIELQKNALFMPDTKPRLSRGQTNSK